jgi:DNA-binding SARP family transcriptional activator/tetratricopeptide (TPR) repeat protein
LDPDAPFFQFPEALDGDCVEAWRLFVANPERSRELALRAFTAAGKPLSTGWAGICLAYHLTRGAETAPATAAVERTQRLFEDLREPRGIALAGVSLAYLEIMRGQPDQAATRLERIAEAYARSASVAPLDHFLAYHALALAYARQGHVDRVLHHHYANLLLLEQCGSPPPLAVVLLNLSSTLAAIDDWEESLQLARRAVSCCEGFDNAALKRRAEINVALSLRFLGKLPEALELLARLRAEPFRDRGSDFALHINSAEASAHHGDLDDARRWLEQATQYQAPAGDPHESANVEWISGLIAAKGGDLAGAIGRLEKARRDVNALKKMHVPLLPRIVEVLASCYARSGEPARAFETYQSFHEAYEARLGYTTRARYTGEKSRWGVAAIRTALWYGVDETDRAANKPVEHARLNEALRRTLATASEDERGALASWSEHSIARLSAEARGLGIDARYVGGIVDSLHRSPNPSGAAAPSQAVRVFALGRFEIRVDGHPLRFGRKRPARPLMLLKYLAAHGTRELPEARVADALWPDLEGDAALRTLAVNLHRLRRLLGGADSVVHRAHRIALDSSRVWCDTIAFEWLLDQAAAAEDREERHRIVERAFALYGGDLSIDEDREAWALAARERLRGRLVGAAAADGAWLAAAGRWDETFACFSRGLEVDDRAEELCLGLMHCCLALGRPVEGIAAYRRLEGALARHSGSRPAAASQALYHQLTARVP